MRLALQEAMLACAVFTWALNVQAQPCSDPIPPTFHEHFACEGNFALCEGQVYSSPGLYPHQYTTPEGCDSLVYCVIDIVDPIITFLQETICSPDCISIAGSTYCNPGSYEIVLTSYQGCDSVILLILDVLPPPTIQAVNPPICEGATDCMRVCAGEPVSFQAVPSNGAGPPGQSASWTAPGAQNITPINSNTSAITWDVPGFYSVEAFFPNSGCGTPGSLCVEVIPRPEANASASPGLLGNTLEVCTGQPVYFENQSTGYTQQLWSFGDGSTSTAANPEYVFTAPGQYEVILALLNACACPDYDTLYVEVLPGVAPDIACTGTVCAGEVSTYSTQAECSNFVWNITGDGTIIAGGGISDTFCIVQWNSGPEGSISLLASGCAGGDCPTTTEVRIPILDTNAPIAGPAVVCPDVLVYYEIPPYEATDFIWEVSGGGMIVSGQGSHQIGVQWFYTPQDQWVSVEYNNCYLNCQGTGYLDVVVRNEFRVEGPNRVCPNTTESYSAQNIFPGTQGPWEFTLQDDAGTVLFDPGSSGTSAMIEFGVPSGSYWIVATPVVAGDYCQPEARRRVWVLDAPAPPDSIAGEALICPGAPYTYRAFSSGSSEGRYRWTLTGAEGPATLEGNPVHITWADAGPYEIQVEWVGDAAPFCASEPFVWQLQHLPPPQLSDAEFCVDVPETLVLLNPNESAPYTWSIHPASEGSLLSPQGGPTMEVVWHTPNLPNAQIIVEQCGLADTLSGFSVGDAPEFPLGPISPVCPGVTTLIDNTWADDIQWFTSDMVPVPSGMSTISLEAGEYVVVAQNAQGCSRQSRVEILQNFVPQPYISTPNLTIICPPDPHPLLIAPSYPPGWAYQWLQDGSPIPGATSSTYATTTEGVYELEVTTDQGCIATSNSITVTHLCDGGIGVPGVIPSDICIPGVDVQMQVQYTANCDRVDYLNTSASMIPGTQLWIFGDGNGSTEESPTHTYAEAGYYLSFLIGATFPLGELCWDSVVVVVPLAAAFTAETVCIGNTMDFTDRTTIMTGQSIASWSWDFGDPASGADNTSSEQNPSHLFSTPGTYTVTLTVVASSGCQSVHTADVVVRPTPAPNFVHDAPVCERGAITFSALGTFLSYAWDFGDPISGTANISALQQAAHVYEQSGIYTASLSVTDNFGCTGNVSQVLEVVPNTLLGNIDPGGPISLCEGDSVQLSSPPGADTWLWSTGSTSADITVLEAGVYHLTVSSNEGCSYEPDPVVVNTVPEPLRELFAVELDEFGLPVNYFPDGYTVCEGEDVVLQLDASQAGQAYSWSTGGGGIEVAFTEERGNLLSAGTYNFSVTVTDIGSGCSVVLGPLEVIVHPRPDVPIISAPASPLCAGTTYTLSVVNPDANLSYLWSTTEQGTSIETFGAGAYVVSAQNNFGCRTPSEPVTVEEGPDMLRIPTGCRVRCNPDTICLPPLPGIVDFQWFMNGAPVPPPNGTAAELVATESGVYALQMTDALGCTALSAPLSLDVYDGYGTLGGQVFVDVNENGLIDAGDTTISGIVLLLYQDGALIGSISSNASGSYAFPDLISGNYIIEVDSASLPPGMSINLSSEDVQLIGCDDVELVDWFLNPSCPPLFGEESFMLCPGDSVVYLGEVLVPGVVQDFLFSSQNGCDSIVTVTVQGLPVQNSSLSLSTCPGVAVQYVGVDLLPGASQDFVFSDQNGCDSIVTVTVQGLPVQNSSLSLSTCPGVPVQYAGVDLLPGASQDFVFSDQNGCDSIVTVTVQGLPVQNSSLSLSTCPDVPVQYAGVDLLPGDVQSFLFPDQNGCDSMVTVSVQGLPVQNSSLSLSTCPGVAVQYAGVDLLPGASQDFVFSDQNGCDSIVTVTVQGLPVQNSNLSLSTCPGVAVQYAGVDLLPGDIQSFAFPDQNGCDSIVTVSVSSLPVSQESLQLSTCAGYTIDYNGTQLNAGDTAVFTFTNSVGCDSVVTVNVGELPSFSSELQLFTCEGEPVPYGQATLEAGDVQSFALTALNGCDSTVTVSVLAYPAVSFQMETDTVCPDQTGWIEVTQVQGGDGNYLFSVNGEPYQEEPLLSGLGAGTYTVQVQDGFGCAYSESVSIPSRSVTQWELEIDPVPCEGGPGRVRPVVLTGDIRTVQFFWPDEQMGEVWETTSPGMFELVVTDLCGEYRESFEVGMESNDRVSLMYVPNAFSPNFDGVNDEFRVFMAPNVEVRSFVLRVYDRWGDLTFETFDPEVGWNGIFRDRMMNPAVFVYYVQAEIVACGRVVSLYKEGDVTLIR